MQGGKVKSVTSIQPRVCAAASLPLSARARGLLDSSHFCDVHSAELKGIGRDRLRSSHPRLAQLSDKNQLNFKAL